MIIGIDEVGRGCWAGPLVAAAVILNNPLEGLNDSKKLSKKHRAELAVLIHENAQVGIGWVTPGEVDNLGLTEAVRFAMQRAVDELDVIANEVIIDGNYNYLPHIVGSRAEVRADGNVAEVSAASIVAKVARDTYMERLDDAYLPWQFSKHVGYGTAAHIAALRQYGISDIHRLSYKPIKAFL